MPATLIRDESTAGDLVRTQLLDFGVEEITVRDLIIRRVQEEIREHRRRERGVGGSTDADAGWERQCEMALAAFVKNGFFILVGDRQVRELDETIRLDLHTDVTFVSLVPLVGG